MKTRLIILFILIMTLCFGPVLAKNQRRAVSFFAPGSFYFYALGSWASIHPTSDFSYPQESDFTPVFGMGYRLINFYNRYFLNFEIDYTSASLQSYDRSDRVRTLNFKLGLEYILSKESRVSLFGNIGVSSLTYPDHLYYEYGNRTAMIMDCGLKIPFSKNLSLRADVRFIVIPDEIDYWYDDDWYWYNDIIYLADENKHVGTTLALGFQLSF